MNQKKKKEKKKGLNKISDLLLDLDLDKRRRYISQEFQAYGLMLADELKDWKNKSLYMKLAKTVPRETLEKARYFIKDQNRGTIKSRARLFMWKLKELKKEAKVLKKKPLDKLPPSLLPKR